MRIVAWYLGRGPEVIRREAWIWWFMCNAKILGCTRYFADKSVNNIASASYILRKRNYALCNFSQRFRWHLITSKIETNIASEDSASRVRARSNEDLHGRESSSIVFQLYHRYILLRSFMKKIWKNNFVPHTPFRIMSHSENFWILFIDWRGCWEFFFFFF